MDFWKNVLYGLIIGTANIIPGVSGGTMAVVLGIYDRLIDAIGSLRRRFWESVKYLFPIGIGAAGGILIFSTLMKLLLERYPAPTNFFFLGLVLGGVPVIVRRARSEHFCKRNLVPFTAALAVMLAIFALSLMNNESTQLITVLTPLTAVQLFVCGAVASACMILPGVSGSMVLVILGVYTSVLTAISELNLAILIPTGLGILAGILGGAKVIEICLRRFEQGTYCAILGLILGSVFPILHNAQIGLNLQGAASLFTLALGIAVSVLMLRLQKHLEK